MPNLIYKKIRYALDIDKEIDVMEYKIEKLNNYIHEKQEEKTNIILTIISGIALVSSLIGISDWLQTIFSVSSKFIPIFSITSITVILTTILLVFLISRKR